MDGTLFSAVLKLTNSQADGRDSDVTMMSGSFRISREVYVPQYEDGLLHYTIMGIIAANDADSGWAVKELAVEPFPVATEPPAITLTAMDGMGVSKGGFQTSVEAPNWGGNAAHME